jgi:hypothetical protein
LTVAKTALDAPAAVEAAEKVMKIAFGAVQYRRL